VWSTQHYSITYQHAASCTATHWRSQAKLEPTRHILQTVVLHPNPPPRTHLQEGIAPAYLDQFIHKSVHV
jgi:hypothetical protein